MGDRLELSSAKRVNASFVSEGLKNRESDIIWEFRLRESGEPAYVYILLEFQSRPDRYMPVRLMTYMGLFFQTLIAGSHLPASGLLPLVAGSGARGIDRAGGSLRRAVRTAAPL